MDQFMDCGPNCRELDHHTRVGQCILSPESRTFDKPETPPVVPAKLYADTLLAVSYMVVPLEEAFPADSDYYAEGELRVWHKDGFSPGYFYQTEIGWVFHPSYLES